MANFSNESKSSKLFRLFKDVIEMFIFWLISFIYKSKNKMNKDLWLISERGTEAKDNGFALFKYIRSNHPEINIAFVIDTDSKLDFKKASEHGRVIPYKGFEHKLSFFKASVLVSSHIGFVEPWSYRLFKKTLGVFLKKKYACIQHGILLHDFSIFFDKKKTFLDLITTSTVAEFESVYSNSNYGLKDEVVLTGCARYDNLVNCNVKNQILLMPTWRVDIVKPSYLGSRERDAEAFLTSEYYSKLQSLINNPSLLNLLREFNCELVFYPHYEIQPYLDLFSAKSERIVIASNLEYCIQSLLKESSLLITDYSSVCFDFGYMKKPILFYQFDEIHYESGYFSYHEDGFGEVLSEEEGLVKEVEVFLKNGFIMSEKFRERVDRSFKFTDSNNCERVFSAIKGILP